MADQYIHYTFMYLHLTLSLYIDLEAKQKSWSWGYVAKRDNKNQPCAAKIMNVIPVVYSECVLKVGDSYSQLPLMAGVYYMYSHFLSITDDLDSLLDGD